MTGVWTFLTGPNWSGDDGIWTRLGEHLQYSVVALLVALVVALPIGAVIGHTGRGTTVAVLVVNVIRAIPSLGLLTLLVLWGLDLVPTDVSPGAREFLGLYLPSILVLVVLGIPPILTNTYSGIRAVDPAARDAARGMGMTGRQVLFRVELPVAAPLIVAGIRSAYLQIVATATILALVLTLNGLGRFILDGPKEPVNGYGIMAGGAVLVALLAIVGDRVIALLGRTVISPGLRTRRTGRTTALRRRRSTDPRSTTAAPDGDTAGDATPAVAAAPH